MTEYSNYDDIEPILPVEDEIEEATTDTEVEDSPTTGGEAENGEADENATEEVTGDGENDTPEEVKSEEKITIRYNHEDREFTLDELKTLAQKGMKFDEVSEDLRLSKEIATRLGHRNISDMARAVDANEIKKRADEYIDEGVPEKLAKRLAKEDYEKESKNIVREQDKPAPEPEHTATVGDVIKAEVAEFSKAFPEVKKIPDEVFKIKNEKGLGLTAAYGVYLSNKTQSENKALKQKAEVAKKAPIRSATSHGGTAQKAADPFLAGFNED